METHGLLSSPTSNSATSEDDFDEEYENNNYGYDREECQQSDDQEVNGESPKNESVANENEIAAANVVNDGEKTSKRPILYSENSYGLFARNRHTNHLTVECLVSVPAQVLVYDDALCGFLPYSMCNINLLQQITCHTLLSNANAQPIARNSSWSADLSNAKNTLATPSVTKVTPIWEYSIQCQRRSDSKTIFDCPLAPHMTYICALPTFHHFRIGEKKFALSFGSDYSASKFHNKIQKALSHLSRQSKSTIAGSGESNLDAADDLDDDVFATDSNEVPLNIRPWPRKPIVPNNLPPLCPSVSVTNHLNEEVDYYNEDDFPLCSMRPGAGRITSDNTDPPMDPESARPAVLSLATVSPCVNCHKCYGSPQFLSSLTSVNEPNNYVRPEVKKLNLTPKGSADGEIFKPKLVQSSSSGAASDKSSRFAKMRSIRSSSNPGSIMLISKLSAKSSREGEISKSKSLLESHLRQSYTNKENAYSLRNASFELVQREFCFYCNQWYNVKDNKKGACPEAPDAIEKFIKRITLYSWASRFVNKRLQPRPNEPCAPACDPSCFTPETTRSFRRKVWFSILACLFPCICCYAPLTHIYHSEAFYSICTCCGRWPPPAVQQPSVVPTTTPSTRRTNRRHLLRTSKHLPVSQKLCKATTTTNSKRHFDQLHSRTSSSQQILNDSYLNFKTVSGYGSLLQGSIDNGTNGISSEKPSGEAASRTEKSTRRLVSRLSF